MGHPGAAKIVAEGGVSRGDGRVEGGLEWVIKSPSSHGPMQSCPSITGLVFPGRTGLEVAASWP